jgi:pSer/pThr/pTyr-binding forkhead associated (FHA) protein
MVKCPNCDTMNPIDRRYCDECGQDLRSAVAAAMAGTLPEVEATTPYLETLSRADEQLEFVLARDLITVGRSLDNDIVIDDQFIGWQTVSPRHAELRRTPDGFVLRDLNSENGTFVNSLRTGENVLEDGMTLAFGKVEFIYRVPTE